MSRCLTSIAVSFALLLVGSSAFASVREKVQEMTPPANSQEFLKKAADGNMLEIKLSELAQQKAASQDVKQLAQQMTQDHQKLGQQIQQLADAKKIKLDKDLKGEQEQTYKAFERLNGKDFDEAYVLLLVTDHLHDLMMFQKESKSGTDADVRQLATQALPTLREHAQHAAHVAQASGIPIDAVAVGSTTGEARPAGSRQPGSSDQPKENPDMKR